MIKTSPVKKCFNENMYLQLLLPKLVFKFKKKNGILIRLHMHAVRRFNCKWLSTRNFPYRNEISPVLFPSPSL